MNEQPKTVEEQKSDTKINTHKYKPQHIDFIQRILTKYSFNNIDAVKEIINAYYDNLSADWHSAGFDDGMVFAEKIHQSDPAFIADIVRQTLEYVSGNSLLRHRTYLTDQVTVAPYFDNQTGRIRVHDSGILAMHPEIVNNIIKKKP